MNEKELLLTDQEVARWRTQFPLLAARPEIAYLDNAATTQKPQAVLAAERDFYECTNANPLRGFYDLSLAATAEYERARQRVAQFGHTRPAEVIFTSGTTMGLNLAAASLGDWLLEPGDEIVLSTLEHHSNLLPWQTVAARHGAHLSWVEPDGFGDLTAAAVAAQLTDRTKIVAITAMSNVLGQPVPVAEITRAAHKRGAVVVVDAAQAVAHGSLNLSDWGADLVAFSGHKLYGPMGIGILTGRSEILTAMPPFLTGGEMIETVTRETFTPAPLPQKFEAGTVNAAGAVGLAAAIDFMERIGWDRVYQREQWLSDYLVTNLQRVSQVRLLGDPRPRRHLGVVSLVVADVHPHDVAEILGSQQICVRAGQHCAAPAHESLGLPASVRVSLAWYNTTAEIDRLLTVLSTVRSRMGYDD